MNRIVTTAWLAVLAVGCGKSSEKSGGQGEAPAGGAAPAAPAGAKNDWTGKKLVPTDVTVDGVSFTVSVPDGLPKDANRPGDWSSAKPEWDYAPKIFTTVLPADSIKSVEDAMSNVAMIVEEANFVRKDTRPDGYGLTNAKATKTNIEAVTFKRAGDKLIKCKAVQVGESELPNYDKTKTMLESICDSVTPKPS